MEELLRALRPVKKRIRRNRLLRGAAAGLIPGAAAALILLAVTAFVPLENRWPAAGAALAGGVLLFAAGSALRPVKNREAARTADACGLRERTVTALETAGRAPAEGKAAEMTEALQKDACAHLAALDVRKIRPERIPKAWILAGAALLLLCAGTLLIPGNGDRILAERRQLKEKTTAMAKQIDEAASAEEAGLGEKEKAELRKLTEDLKRDLAESRDSVDAMVALDKAEEKLEEIRRKTAGEAQKELADALREAGLDAAADALENGDAESMNQALAEMKGSAENQEWPAMEGLSAEAREMAEQLEKAAEAGEISGEQMEAITAGTKGNASQSGALQQAVSGMKAALGNGQTQQSGQNGTNGGTPGAGSRGQNGGGAGTGSTNTEQEGGGGSRDSAGSSGNRPPEYREGAYETIYDPEKAEKSTRDVMTEQNGLGRDSVQIETGPGKGKLEGDVPFREVVGEYAKTEAQAAESAHLTQEQKEWVDEYFRRLTDE